MSSAPQPRSSEGAAAHCSAQATSPSHIRPQRHATRDTLYVTSGYPHVQGRRRRVRALFPESRYWAPRRLPCAFTRRPCFIRLVCPSPSCECTTLGHRPPKSTAPGSSTWHAKRTRVGRTRVDGVQLIYLKMKAFDQLNYDRCPIQQIPQGSARLSVQHIQVHAPSINIKPISLAEVNSVTATLHVHGPGHHELERGNDSHLIKQLH